MENYAELLETLAQQEKQLQFTAFTSDTALALGLKVIELARQRDKSVTVNVTVNGKVLFHHAMQGATPDQADWIRRKSNVVTRFGRCSYQIGTDYKNRGVAFEEVKYLDPKEYAPYGGSFPVVVRNVGLIGTATVSGLRQAEDHAIVVEALRAVLV